jgi:hypothetical protein
MWRALVCILPVPLLFACSERDGALDETESGIDGGNLDGGDGDGDGGDGDGGGERYDVGGGNDGGGGGSPSGSDEVCKKVDVIISVDNSGSMVEEIAALSGPVFESFPESLLAVGNGLEDFHLAVIDACNNPAAFHDTGNSGSCSFSSQTNFMVSSSPALFQEYGCAMELSTSGHQGMPDVCTGNNDDEQPANTIASSISAPAVDQYNSGFMREDAVLFVVALTDEDEQPLPAKDPAEIAQEIIDAKGGVENVVFLGVAGQEACVGDYGSAEAAPNLQAVAAVFEAQDRGLFWDICAGSLEEAFQAGLEIVDSACEDFTPPG